MVEHFFYLIALTFMLMHELDAIRCKEWRIFPGLSMLNEKMAYPIFVFAHLPLFYWILFSTAIQKNENTIWGLNVFFIIHLFLHLLFIKHPKNLFKDWLSWTLIVGAALFSTLDLFYYS